MTGQNTLALYVIIVACVGVPLIIATAQQPAPARVPVPVHVVSEGEPTRAPYAFRDAPVCDGRAGSFEPACTAPEPPPVELDALDFAVITVREPAPAPKRVVITVREVIQVPVPTPEPVPELPTWQGWDIAPASAPAPLPTTVPWESEGWDIESLPEVKPAEPWYQGLPEVKPAKPRKPWYQS